MMRTQLALIRILPVFVSIVEFRCRNKYSPDIFQLVSFSLSLFQHFDSSTVNLVYVFAPRSYFCFHLYDPLPYISSLCVCVCVAVCERMYVFFRFCCQQCVRMHLREFRILFMSLFYGIHFVFFCLLTEHNHS